MARNSSNQRLAEIALLVFCAVVFVEGFTTTTTTTPTKGSLPLSSANPLRRSFAIHRTVLQQSSVAVPTSSSSSDGTAEAAADISGMRLRDIQAELKQLQVSYHDCFDRQSLVDRLADARRKNDNKAPAASHNIYEPSATVTTSATTTKTDNNAATLDVDSKVAELREKSLKELKLECSKRNLRYATFREKVDFVNAIVQDMKASLDFSVSGRLRPGTVTEVNSDILDEEINSQQQMSSYDTPILVDVFATWCGPCKMIVPQLEAAAKKFGSNVRVVKIDSDQNQSWAAKYQVQGLPTMLLIKDGQVVDRLEGAHMTDTIVDFVEKHSG